jgi:hypothetical protein
VVTAVGRSHMQRQLAVVVVEGRVALGRPMDPAALNDPHHLCIGLTKDVHDLMEVWAACLGITMGDALREDARGPLLHGTHDVEQPAPGDPAPRAIASPRLPFERLFTSDVPLAQWPRGEALALGAAPPAQPGQGKAPQDGVLVVE